MSRYVLGQGRSCHRELFNKVLVMFFSDVCQNVFCFSKVEDHRNTSMIKCFLVLSVESFVLVDVSTRVRNAIEDGILRILKHIK